MFLEISEASEGRRTRQADAQTLLHILFFYLIHPPAARPQGQQQRDSERHDIGSRLQLTQYTVVHQLRGRRQMPAMSQMVGTLITAVSTPYRPVAMHMHRHRQQKRRIKRQQNAPKGLSTSDSALFG